MAFAQEPGATTDGDFKIVPFDDAMPRQIVRSMPLKLAFPKDFEMLVLSSANAGVIWALPADLDQIRQTGEASSDGSYFHGRLTLSVGYDSSKNAFICGPSCGEADYESKLKDAGADNIKMEKHVVNGIPLLLIEGNTGGMRGTVRKRFYLAYMALMIDTNVFLVSYRSPKDSPDDGASVWKAFSKALTQSSDAGRRDAEPRQQPTFQDYLEMSARSGAFRAAADDFIAAAVAGDATKSMALISRNAINSVGQESAQSYLTTQVLPFFARFKELGKSVTIAPTSDRFGSTGFVFHLSMAPVEGDERPFAIYVVEENGAKVIADVLPDHDFKASTRAGSQTPGAPAPTR